MTGQKEGDLLIQVTA